MADADLRQSDLCKGKLTIHPVRASVHQNWLQLWAKTVCFEPMPSTTRGLPPFIPVPGWFVAESSRLIALVFSRPATAVSLRLFVVISCVAEGPTGALLCFRTGPGGNLA